MNIKTKSWLVLGGFIIYVLFTLLFIDDITRLVANSNAFVGILVYLLGNPAYVILIYYVVKYSNRRIWKKTLASIFMIFSLDAVALPRIMLSSIPNDGTNVAAIITKSLVNFGFNPTLAYYTFYLVLPIILFWTSMEWLGTVDFIKKMKNGGV